MTGAWASELRAMLALAWPLILSNLTMSLIQATDVLLMGRLGAHELAASALGLNLAMPLMVFGMGLLLAAPPLMAAELGRRRHAVREVRRTFAQSLWVLAVALVPIWILLWNTESVLLALGQNPALAAGAQQFMRGYQWCLAPFLLFQAIRNFLSALERPGWVLAASLVGIMLNALLGWALIFGHLGAPRLGLFGGGLASTISWSLVALLLAGVILRERRFRRYRLLGGVAHADWERLRALWAIGMPIALTLVFEAAVFGAAIFLMGLIDEVSVAAHAVALQVAALTFMVPLGLGQAATVRVGLAFGRNDRAGVARAGWTAFTLGVGFMTAMALVIWLVPRPLAGLFLDADRDARTLDVAVSFLLVAAAFQVFDGAQVVAAGMLRGLQDTRVPMLIAGFGYWVIGIGVGSLLAFPGGWRGVGVWVGLAAGLAVVAVLLLWRWHRRDRLFAVA